MAAEDKDKTIRELTERLKLREQELDVADRLPRVPPFVKAHSTTWTNEGASRHTSWISCLPLEKLPFDRCCELLDILAGLHAQSSGSIFQIRTKSLFPCLDGLTERDLEDLAYVVEYLQLPKQLKVKLDRTVAADAFQEGDLPATDLVANPLLEPLWNVAVEDLQIVLFPNRALSLKERVIKSLFAWEGLLGTPADGMCTGFDPAAYPLYIAGLVLGGHTPDLAALPKPWIPAATKAPRFDSECYLPLEAAAYKAPVPVLRGLLNAGWPWCDYAAYAAAACGRVSVLACALERKLALPVDTYSAAARGDSKKVIQWLHGTAKLAIPVETSACAALAGRLEMLQVLRALGAPWSAKTCTFAAQSGELAILRWLRAQAPPCPWDASACVEAAKRDDLTTLQWLRAQEPPCPWTSDVVAKAGTAEVREWALANGCPAPAAAPVPPA
jgi:hypothetical protein